MTQRPAVNLDDLRIEEPVRRTGGGKLLVILLVLLVPIAFVLGWFLRGGSSGGFLGGAVPVRVETVRATSGGGDDRGSFSEGGWVEVPSYHPIEVTALVGGRVEELLVLEGTPVTEETVIARLYAKDFQDALREAEAAVAEAKADLDLFEAGYRSEDVDKARAESTRLAEELALTGKVLERTRGLVPSGAASAEDLERDAAAVEVARARHASAQHELRRLEAGFRPEEIAKARATLARATATRDLAARRLGYCEVKSPVKGVVLRRHVTPGTWLPAGNPRLVSLYDPGDLQVRVDVRQENAGRISVGQKVEIATESQPDHVYHGEVIRIEPLADFKKNTIQVKIRIMDPGPRLHPEMICRARFLKLARDPAAEPAPQILTVSAAAVVREGGRTFVFRVRDGRAIRGEVRLGEESGGRIVVLSGVAPGDRVVSAPTPDLADGAEVEVVTP